jgi:hypothetical protein
MLVQVDRLDTLFSEHRGPQEQWQALTREHHVLDDIVDRTANIEGLPEDKMRLRIIDLYRCYVSEWKYARTVR